MLKVTITATGHDEPDLAKALEEIAYLLRGGAASGRGSIDRAEYTYELQGERENVSGESDK